MKHKLMSGLCAAAMLCTALPMGMTASAEGDVTFSGSCGDNVTWSFDRSTGTMTISGKGEMYDYFDWKPWSYDPEKDISMVEYDEITSVVVEEGITYIGDFAFYGDENISSVTLPESLEGIGLYSFKDTAWLLNSEPDENGFLIVDGILFDAYSLTGDVKLTDTVKTIAGGAFTRGGMADQMGSSVTSVEIPDGVKQIGTRAFYNCNELTAVTIPEGVTKIGAQAFIYCDKLTEITLPASLVQLTGDTFTNCPSLNAVTILNPSLDFQDPYAQRIFGNEWSEEKQEYIYNGSLYGYDNSTAEAYAKENGYTFVSLGAAPAEPETPAVLIGDISGDSKIDASDAADLLIALANIGAGEPSGLTDEQLAAADTDGNGEYNAADATVILQYAAFLGAGGTGTLPEFLASE